MTARLAGPPIPPELNPMHTLKLNPRDLLSLRVLTRKIGRDHDGQSSKRAGANATSRHLEQQLDLDYQARQTHSIEPDALCHK